MATLTITAANVQHQSNAALRSGIAGVAITAGDVLYLDEATSTLKLSQSDTAVKADAVGIAANDAAIGQPVSYQVSGTITLGTGAFLQRGRIYIVANDVAGGIAPDSDVGAGDYVTILGVAINDTDLAVAIFVSGVDLD